MAFFSLFYIYLFVSSFSIVFADNPLSHLIGRSGLPLDDPLQVVNELLSRVLPEHASFFVLDLIPPVVVKDSNNIKEFEIFEIDSAESMIKISFL